MLISAQELLSRLRPELPQALQLAQREQAQERLAAQTAQQARQA